MGLPAALRSTIIGGHYTIGTVINIGGLVVYRGVDSSEGQRLVLSKKL